MQRARLPILLVLLAAGCVRSSSAGPLEPPAAWLPSIPDGYGSPYRAEATLRVRDRALVLPSGQACAGADACAAPLAALRDRALALELEGTVRMGELSGPLAALGQALDDSEFACLVVRDSNGRRCLPFRPFGGRDFGEWLDAEKPLGKLRVILRADGMEVVADRGKVPGPDRFGPSLPPIGGLPDLARLDTTMAALVSRFPDEEEAVLAPSPGLPVEQVAAALARIGGPGGDRLERLYLVYP